MSVTATEPDKAGAGSALAQASSAGSQALDVRALIDAVRALRKAPPAERDWSLFATLMRQLCRARAALVVAWSPQPRILGQDMQVAQWQPTQEPGFAELHGRAQQNGHAWGPSTGADARPYLLVMVRVFGMSDTVLLLNLDEQQRAQVNEMVLRALLAADFSAGAPAAAAIPDMLASMIDLSAEVMAQTSFQAAALALVNGVTVKLDVVYAALGWVDGSIVRTVAISQLDRFDRKSEQVQQLEEIFDEVRLQDHEMWESADGGALNPQAPLAVFAAERGSHQVGALPMRDAGGRLHAVLLCAFGEGVTEPPDMGPLMLSLDLMQPRLADQFWQQQGWPRRAGARVKAGAAALLGPEHVWAKLFGVLALVVLAYLFLGTWQHRIDASAQMTTESTRLVSAQYDGRVDKVLVTAGDLVKQGALLFELDQRELRQQEAELLAEIRRMQAEVGKFRASESLSEMEIAQARLDQTLARKARVEQYMQQSVALAPFDGVVVEGERKDLLGAPVRKGEMLMRVAKVEGLYATLQVPERDIRDIAQGATGELLLLSHPDQAIPIEITAVIPVAQVKGQQGNHFMVHARLLQAPEPWWRPGMTGLAKIEVGERRVIWILTHKLIDNLRMTFWW